MQQIHDFFASFSTETKSSKPYINGSGNLSISSHGSLSQLAKEVRELEYRVFTLKHPEELTPDVLARISARLSHTGCSCE